MDLIIKGFIIGIGKIIPGVSGAMFAIMLGVYEPMLEKISNIRKDFLKNCIYLSKLGFGILLSIIFVSNIIVKCLECFYFPTMLLFIGMIIGGISDIFKEVKFSFNNLLFIFIVCVVLFLILFNVGNPIPKQVDYSISFFISMVGVGFLDAASSVIPGISGTALLMSLGYYNIVLNMFGSMFDVSCIGSNLFVGIPFVIGIVLGIVVVSKILNYLFKCFKGGVYTLILILVFVTTFILLKNVFLSGFSGLEFWFGMVLFVLGVFISLKLGNK